MKVKEAIGYLSMMDAEQEIYIDWWTVVDVDDVLLANDLDFDYITKEEKISLIASFEPPKESNSAIRKEILSYIEEIKND